jgi:hypothetical protein
LCRRNQGEQFEVYGVGRQFLTTLAMDFESSGRLNQDWEHGTLQWAVEHTVFVVFDVPCSSWEGFDVMATQFLEAPNAQSWPEMLGLYLVGRILDLGKGNGEGVYPTIGWLLALS